MRSSWRIFRAELQTHPVCRWAQPPLRAVLDLRTRHGLTSDQVERIEVTAFHQLLRLAVRRPSSTEEAQYSTSFPIAAAMVRGAVGPDDVAAGSLADPEILRLSECMIVTESDACDASFPANCIAHVSLVLKIGGG